MSMYHFSDTEAVEHDVNTVPDFGDFERVEIDGQWYVPERTCQNFGGEEGTVGEGYDFACSACGWCGDVTEPNYCPNCGARVVVE